MFRGPSKDCPICPRLYAFREDNRRKFPDKFNAPVPAFGGLDARLLIVGLAPGLKGANFSGRPFTGDYAGIILYKALLKGGFATGNYNPDAFFDTARKTTDADSLLRGNDSLQLVDCRITNAVRCVPPENKPENSEIKNCNQFLQNEIAAMPKLKLILSLGLISHNAVLRALGLKVSAAKFTHGGIHKIGDVTLLDSYHCSRYNINTGRLTPEMFDEIMAKAKMLLAK